MAPNNQAGQINVEFMLMKFPKKIFPESAKFLLNPNINIADTVENCYTTPHTTGFVKLKNATEEGYIQASSGEKMISTNVVKLLILCRNMSHNALVGHPDARLETMVSVKQTYVLVQNVSNRQ